MKHYIQLGIKEREAIQVGLWAGKSIRMIALELGRAPSQTREGRMIAHGGSWPPKMTSSAAFILNE